MTIRIEVLLEFIKQWRRPIKQLKENVEVISKECHYDNSSRRCMMSLLERMVSLKERL